MNLFELTHARNQAGGGTKTATKNVKIGGQM